MKKTLYIIIAAVLIFILSGCLNNNEEPTTQPTKESTTLQTTTEATTKPTTTETTVNITTSSAITEEATESTTETTTSVPDKEETKLWAKQDVNVREKPTADSKKLGVLHEGNSIIRTAVTGSWSKVIFDGEVAYIHSSYLTDKEPAKSVSTVETVIDPYVENWNLLVVNTKIAIPGDYVPKLAEVASSGIYLDYRVAPHYNDMYAAAKKDGITLTPFSGYRSYARQQRNYNNLVNKYMSQYNLNREEAAAKAATVILPPGTSEHNLGLAMDICNTNASFSSQKEYKWLMEHAHEYGFILRYTAEKQSITGIIPEPWHWRYVGVEHAKKIKDSGLCLEEYLTQNGIAY